MPRKKKVEIPVEEMENINPIEQPKPIIQPMVMASTAIPERQVMSLSEEIKDYISRRATGEAVDNDLDKGVAAYVTIEELRINITNMQSSIETLQSSIDALQAEATAKWVLLNTVDNRSRANANAIAILQGGSAMYEVDELKTE